MGVKDLSFSTEKTVTHIVIYFLIYIVGVYGCKAVGDWAFTMYPGHSAYFITFCSSLATLIVTFLLFWIYTHRFLHLKMRDFRVTFNIKWWAILLAVLLPALIIGIFVQFGTFKLNNPPAANDTFWLIIYSLTHAVELGVLEECLFRGFIMRLLEDRWNVYVAVLLNSLLFGLVHIPSFESLSSGGIMYLIGCMTLMGVMLSLVTLTGASVSDAAAIHTVYSFVFGANVLQIAARQNIQGKPLFSILLPDNNVWSTEGGFGVDSSLVCMVVFLIMAILFYALIRYREYRGVSEN